jgi:hypothetical protein
VIGVWPARVLLTALLAASGLASWPAGGRPGTRPADRVSAAFHALMSLGLIVMTWRSAPVLPWAQAAVFGCAVLWFALAAPRLTAGTQARSASSWHALMAGAMIWMIFAMPAAMPMAPAHGMTPAPNPATPMAVLVVSALLAAYFGFAAIPWLVRATGPGPRLRDAAAAGHAAMSAGMAVLLLAML